MSNEKHDVPRSPGASATNTCSNSSTHYKEIMEMLNRINNNQETLYTRLKRIEKSLLDARYNADSKAPSDNVPKSPIWRTRHIKDQMIQEKQDRREQMHEIVDDIEAASSHIRCPYCDSAITKHCFINGHFDWCINHQYVASYDRDDDSCFHEDAAGNRFCSVVHCDYTWGEWEEEEFTELLGNQMAKESP